jgi:hypothetical protein
MARAFNFSRQPLSFVRVVPVVREGVVMRRNCSILAAVVFTLTLGASAASSEPWARAYGNSTGGIISYRPDLEGIYPQIASDYCASWGRLSHVTSVNRRYGDYISFVCIDKPGIIH